MLSFNKGNHLQTITDLNMYFLYNWFIVEGRRSRGVVANVLDFGIEVNKFELHSYYLFTFRLISFGKEWIHLSPIQLFFYKDGFGFK